MRQAIRDDPQSHGGRIDMVETHRTVTQEYIATLYMEMTKGRKSCVNPVVALSRLHVKWLDLPLPSAGR